MRKIFLLIIISVFISGCVGPIIDESDNLTLDTETFFNEYPDVKTYVENLPKIKEFLEIHPNPNIEVQNITCNEFKSTYKEEIVSAVDCINLTNKKGWLIKYYSGDGPIAIVTIDSSSKQLLGLYLNFKFEHRCEYTDDGLKFYYFSIPDPEGKYIYVDVIKPLEKEDAIKILATLNHTQISCTIDPNEECDPFLKRDYGWTIVQGPIGVAESYTYIDERYCVIRFTPGL
jgi:hypothetical protein